MLDVFAQNTEIPRGWRKQTLPWPGPGWTYPEKEVGEHQGVSTKIETPTSGEVVCIPLRFCTKHTAAPGPLHLLLLQLQAPQSSLLVSFRSLPHPRGLRGPPYLKIAASILSSSHSILFFYIALAPVSVLNICKYGTQAP